MEQASLERWIEDLRSVPDTEGASVILALEAKRPASVAMSFDGYQELNGRIELSCGLARRLVRPLPGQDVGDQVAMGAAREHLPECPDCSDWLKAMRVALTGGESG